MTVVPWKQVREDLADACYRARTCGDRVLVTRHGKPWVVIIKPTGEDIRQLVDSMQVENSLDMPAAVAAV